MELVRSSLVTAAVNGLVFSLLPVIWWFFRHRKEIGFWRWVGFYPPKRRSRWWVLLTFVMLYAFFFNFDMTRLADPKTLEQIESSAAISANAFAGMGAMAILPALIQNFLANGVGEEILYRGFLCKRFCSRFGVAWGIALQAILFGLMHNVLYILAGIPVGLWYHILTFLFTGTGALLLGLLNEKIYNGSIVPSILLHGAGNFAVSMAAAFG